MGSDYSELDPLSLIHGMSVVPLFFILNNGDTSLSSSPSYGMMIVLFLII